MDKLQPLLLFTDEAWQQCLESFLDTLSRQEAHTRLVDYRTTLRQFFTQERNPADVSMEEVEAFCRQLSYHGPVSYQTVKRRRQAIRDFYAFAQARGIFHGDNPACPPVIDKPAVPIIFSDENWQCCFTHYLEGLHRRSSSDATIVTYVSILARFFTQGLDPQKVVRADVLAFLQQPCASHGKQGKPPQVATRNARASIISSFYQFASGYEIASPSGPVPLYQRANPCAGLTYGKGNRAYKAMNPAEIKRFFAAIDKSTLMGKRDFSLFSFMLMSARRRSSVQRMTFGDLEQGLISDENGGSHEGWLYRFTEKGTSTQQDSAEISSAVVDLIMDYLAHDGRLATATPGMPIWRAHGPEVGGNVREGEVRALSSKAMASAMKKYCRLAGIDERKYSIHSWRHSSAKMRRLAGSSIAEISRTLRHSSLDMTVRYVGALVSQSDNGGRLLEKQLADLGVL